jgi:hypothetical protein
MLYFVFNMSYYVFHMLYYVFHMSYYFFICYTTFSLCHITFFLCYTTFFICYTTFFCHITFFMCYTSFLICHITSCFGLTALRIYSRLGSCVEFLSPKPLCFAIFPVWCMVMRILFQVVLRSSESWGSTHLTTRHHIPEDQALRCSVFTARYNLNFMDCVGGIRS